MNCTIFNIIGRVYEAENISYIFKYSSNSNAINLGTSGWNTLKSLNLSDDSWDGIESLSKLPKLNKLKINGCTFTVIEPETTISKELLSKMKIIKDTSDNEQESNKILEIQLDDFTISENNKSFTIPSIKEVKSLEKLNDIDKPNALTSEIVSDYECSINGYEVSFINDKFEVNEFPVEIKLSSNRVKAIIKINILVDEKLLNDENIEEPTEKGEEIEIPVENGDNSNERDENKNTAPIIKASDKAINIGDKFNQLEGVTASDEEDGDITNRVMVIVNDVDASVEGNYHVIYEVVDSAGNKVNKAMMVCVKEEEVLKKENKPPVINAEDLTIEKGMYFDPLEDITALDEEDGNLTHKIVVKENEVNVSKAGSYKVTYEVTDSMYETTTKSINVTVESNGNIINYELFAKIGGVLLIILIIGSLVSIVIRNKKK